MFASRLSVVLLCLALSGSLLGVLAGCAGQTRVKSDLHIKGAPDWVNRGTGALKDRKGRLFHGVGSAPPMGDRSLQTETADNRARAALARALSAYLEVASSDYSAAGGGALDASVSRRIETVSRINLAGSRVIGRWRDKRSDVIYSLVEMDLKQAREILLKIEGMDAGLRAYLAREGENVFDKMAEGDRP